MRQSASDYYMIMMAYVSVVILLQKFMYNKVLNVGRGDLSIIVVLCILHCTEYYLIKLCA
jgi:hypothetical protein